LLDVLIDLHPVGTKCAPSINKESIEIFTGRTDFTGMRERIAQPVQQ
jgi:hypothetical protein